MGWEALYSIVVVVGGRISKTNNFKVVGCYDPLQGKAMARPETGF